MSDAEANTEVWLVRHGETEWSRSGRHTGRTDLEMTPEGEQAARQLGPVLAGTSFNRVWCSPRLRARRTAELARLDRVEVHDELVEWDYGDYEGLTRVEIQEARPDWQIWTHGAPGGESPQEMATRADGVVAACRDAGGRTLLVAHGHFLRSLAARWIAQPIAVGAHLPLDTARVSVLGFDRGAPTLDRWNSTS
ncbi:MAG: histidine phosphatase family protein [Nocardioidaceae bacterium]